MDSIFDHKVPVGGASIAADFEVGPRKERFVSLQSFYSVLGYSLA